MAANSTKFKVGLFVSVGLLLGAGTIVWLGTGRYFKQAKTYVTYFNESVQGLQLDSAVKYRGVDIGRVDQIKVAPDFRLIEVVMQIHFQGDLERQVVASLRPVGITGIVFVGLDRRPEQLAEDELKLSFTPDYPVIPSRPSEIHRILTEVEKVMNGLRKIDFERLSGQFHDTLRAAHDFFAGPEIKSTVATLKSAVQNLDRATAQISQALDQGRAQELVAEIQGAAQEARQAATALRQGLESLDLARLGRQADQVLGGVQSGSMAVMEDLRVTGDNLRRASESLGNLVQRLQTDPSQLFFSRPQPDRER